MPVDDFGYFEQRAGAERNVAETTLNRTVRARHSQLADRYERAVASFRSLPRDWPIDQIG